MLFGADGDRDTTKRARDGRDRRAGRDIVVITDFHPRFEDPAAIRAALLDGARDGRARAGDLRGRRSPRAAIRTALSLAGEGDAILYAGPGHEDYHEIAGVKIPYSARDDARGAPRGGLGA